MRLRSAAWPAKPRLHLEQPQAFAVEPLHHRHVAIEVGVGDGERQRDVVAATATQEFGDRQARRLADDVEQRHLHGRLGLGMADHGVVGVLHELFYAERVGADQHRPEIDVQGGSIGLDGAGEHRPGRRVAPAGDAGVGFELQNGVLHRACDVARAVAAHQAHRNVGDVDRRRRDLDLLHANPRFPLPLPWPQSIAHYACQPQRGIDMRRNPLRERLNAGKPTVGTHILSAWPTLVELIGHSKLYDYVEFTAEYAPFTMHDLDNLGRSFELMNMSGMIKIEQTQYTHQAMRAIGAGFQSVLFADIRSVEDAEARRRRGTRRDDDGARRARPRATRRRHAPRRRHGARGRLARLCRRAERGRDRHHGREEVVRGRSRSPSCRCRASTWCSSAPPTSP